MARRLEGPEENYTLREVRTCPYNEKMSSQAQETLSIPKGEFLLLEGEDARQLYYVKEGVLTVFKRREGKNHQVGTIYSGEVVGEMSFLANEPRYASVQAATDCEVIVLDTDNLEKMRENFPTWITSLVKTLVARLNHANDRIRI